MELCDDADEEDGYISINDKGMGKRGNESFFIMRAEVGIIPKWRKINESFTWR